MLNVIKPAQSKFNNKNILLELLGQGSWLT